MSTLRANSIEHTDGGPIALTKQHALKAFACIDQTSSGHPTFESLNVSTTTDAGLGRTGIAYTNNMSVTSHSVTMADNGQNFGGSEGGINSDTNHYNNNTNKRTGGCGIDLRNSGNTNRDTDDVSIMSAGDLA